MESRLNNNQIMNILIDFEKEFRNANTEGRAFAFLKEHKIKYDDFDECSYDKSRAKMLIAGASSISDKEIKGILKKFGINIDRVEIITDYEKLKNYNWDAIRYMYSYSDIIVGPMPHKTIGTGDSTSVISRMETEDGWPNIVRSIANTELKITKTSLNNAIIQCEFYNKQLSSY